MQAASPAMQIQNQMGVYSLHSNQGTNSLTSHNNNRFYNQLMLNCVPSTVQPITPLQFNQ